MLSRRARLSTEEFNAVMKKGRVSHSPLFLMRSLAGTSKTAFAAVAPTKIAKTAAKRNTIRRQIYGLIETLQDTGTFTAAQTLIFAKDAYIEASPLERLAALKEIFVKAGVMK